MLDHTKPYVEKIHSGDAELAGHAHKNCRSYVGVFFFCCSAHACQAKPLEWTDQQHIATTKMGYIYL